MRREPTEADGLTSVVLNFPRAWLPRLVAFGLLTEKSALELNRGPIARALLQVIEDRLYNHGAS